MYTWTACATFAQPGNGSGPWYVTAVVASMGSTASMEGSSARKLLNSSIAKTHCLAVFVSRQNFAPDENEAGTQPRKSRLQKLQHVWKDANR